MQSFKFELDRESQELWVIMAPFGKYKYKCLPKGLKCTPDFAQQTMEQFPQGLDIKVYLNDIDIFSNTWEKHLALLEKILSYLKANNTQSPEMQMGHWRNQSAWLIVLVENVVCMSCACPVYVLYLSCTCPVYVLYMSLGRIHVLAL